MLPVHARDPDSHKYGEMQGSRAKGRRLFALFVTEHEIADRAAVSYREDISEIRREQSVGNIGQLIICHVKRGKELNHLEEMSPPALQREKEGLPAGFR